MAKTNFYAVLAAEIERIDQAKTAKRNEKVIEGFSDDPAPQAIIGGKQYLVFNSNDYLGLRFHPKLREAERRATEKYGVGPGAVRFISGTLEVYRELEKAISQFHGREEAMVFSSAFAANLAVIFCLIKGQSKDSLVGGETLVISDELNHRSIIDGIRLANLAAEQKQIFKHLQVADLRRVLAENQGKFKRVVVITDGIFSMLGEQAEVKQLREATEAFDKKYAEGVLLIVDDSHGIAAYGQTGRGCEEATGGRADVLIATFGKGFGVDGGYVVADKVIIDYLRESAATYIYSNSVSPGGAGAALSAVQLVDGNEGRRLLEKSRNNVRQFKQMMQARGFKFAAESSHPIQPLLIGDTQKTQELTQKLFAEGILATKISYPVVPAGRDEIRVQISAAHTKKDLEYFVDKCSRAAKDLGVI